MSRKTGSILSFVTLFLETFTALLFTPFLISSFGPAEYGVYTLVIALASYLSLLDLGVGNSIVRFMAKYRANNDVEEQRKFLGATLIYYLAIAAIAGAIGAVLVMAFPALYATGLSPQEIELAQTLLRLTIVNIVITLATSSFASTVLAYENYVLVRGSGIASVVLRVGIGFVLLSLGFKSVAIFALNTILSIATRLLMTGVVVFKLKLVPKFKGIELAKVKEIVAYSGMILLQMVATQINSMADQVLIGALVPASSVVLGVYAVASQVNQYFQSFGGAINGNLMPSVVRLVERGGTAKDLQAEMTRIGRLNFMFVSIIWCGFLVFGQQFISLWAGSDYNDAYVLALLLMFPYIIILTQSVGTQILWAKNKHKVQSVLKFVIVLLNVVLSVVLIQWHPLYGAVIGTFVSLMLGDVAVMQIVFKKDVGISLRGYYADLLKGILPSLLIAVIAGFAFRLVGLGGWIGFVINCAVMVAAYLLCLLFFGWNNDEKRLFFGVLKKFRKKRNQ